MENSRLFIPIAAATALSVLPQSGQAQTVDMDCKVMLCLPGGFPGGCEDAKAYMLSRIRSVPPKPPFGPCDFEGLDGNGDVQTATGGIAHREIDRVCTRTVTYGDRGDKRSVCRTERVTFERFIHLDFPGPTDPSKREHFEHVYETFSELQDILRDDDRR